MKTWLEAPLQTFVRPALLALALAPSAWATTDNFTTSGTWTCPPNVSSVTVECWGGGGAGGGAQRTGATGQVYAGGGAGGAYAKKVISVTPATVYTVTVGAGGTNVAVNGSSGPGGDSWFSTSGTVLAKGGAGANTVYLTTGSGTGAAGTSTGSIGDLVYAGGSGANGAAGGNNGGGGGSSAGTGSAGNTATNATGATAVAGGGPGGNGATTNAAGTAPASGPGGGGGGARAAAAAQAGGAGYAGQVSVTYTAATSPVVASPTAGSITDTTASLGANITSDGGSAVTARGTVWNTIGSPTSSDNLLAEGGTTTGTFTHGRTGLPAGTLIYYRGYATNSVGTGYSVDGTFRTLSTAPTTASSGIGYSGLSQTDMTVSWTNGDGARRIVIAKSGSAPSGTPASATQYAASATYGSGAALAGGYVVYDGTGSSVAVTGLIAGTTYHFVVYEYNWDGSNTATINYLTSSSLSGSQASNAGLPTVSSPTATSIAATSATLGATVVSDGGGALSARGTVWGTSASPTGNALAASGTTTGAFTHSRSSLPAGTLIYYRGYATNSGGTAYSADGSFYTLSTEPTTSAGSFTATAPSTTSINLSWTAATGANGYLILQASGSTAPTGTPSDATGYSVGNTIGDGTVAAIATGTSTTITGLTLGSQYSFTIVPFNWDSANAATYNYKTSSISSASSFTQFTPKYRSVATGDWNATGTWEVSTDNGTTYGGAASTPTSSDDTILIQTGHTVTVTASVTADQVSVPSGAALTVNASQTLTIADGTGTDLDVSGTLTVNGTLDNNGGLALQTGSTGTVANGGVLKNTGATATITGTPTALATTTLSFAAGAKYQHNQNAGSVPFATWASTSTCEVVGTVANVPAFANWAQSFGNITWNCPSQTANGGFGGFLATVNGNLTVINTGTGALRTGSAYNITIAGDVVIQGGTWDLANAALAASPAISIGGNYNQSGGALNYSNAGTVPIEITFNGANATFTQSAGTILSDKINFTVAASKSLTLNNSFNTGANASRTMTVNGTLLCNGNNVTGSAAFTLGFGGTLGITDALGITSTAASGNIQVTGARSFNTGANYTYNGSVAQVTGNQLPGAVSNLTIANTSGVSLSQGVTVNGTLTVNSSCNLNFNSKTISTGNAPALNGSLTMPVTRTGANTFSGSKLTLTGGTLTYGGTLSSSLVSGGPILGGENIPLFVSTGGFAGGFSSVTAPSDSYYTADTSQLSGGSGGNISYTTTGFTQFESYYGLTGGMDGDDDGDGASNLAEFAFDTLPNNNGSGNGAMTYDAGAGTISAHGTPTINLVKSPASVDFSAVFCRRKDYVSAGLTYTVQFSADLISWSNSTATPAVVASDDTVDAVSVPYPLFITTPQGVRKPQYFRVAVTSTP